MGKYTTYKQEKPKPAPTVHPVMRGIGCIMMVVVPILAYGISILVFNYANLRGWPIPPEWYGPPSIPQILWNLSGLRPVLQFLQNQNNLEAYLVLTIVITIIIGGIMAIIFGILSSAFGPSRYGPHDAPPIRGVKVKRYKR